MALEDLVGSGFFPELDEQFEGIDEQIAARDLLARGFRGTGGGGQQQPILGQESFNSTGGHFSTEFDPAASVDPGQELIDRIMQVNTKRGRGRAPRITIDGITFDFIGGEARARGKVQDPVFQREVGTNANQGDGFGAHGTNFIGQSKPEVSDQLQERAQKALEAKFEEEEGLRAALETAALTGGPEAVGKVAQGFRQQQQRSKQFEQMTKLKEQEAAAKKEEDKKVSIQKRIDGLEAQAVKMLQTRLQQIAKMRADGLPVPKDAEERARADIFENLDAAKVMIQNGETVGPMFLLRGAEGPKSFKLPGDSTGASPTGAATQLPETSLKLAKTQELSAADRAVGSRAAGGSFANELNVAAIQSGTNADEVTSGVRQVIQSAITDRGKLVAGSKLDPQTSIRRLREFMSFYETGKFQDSSAVGNRRPTIQAIDKLIAPMTAVFEDKREARKRLGLAVLNRVVGDLQRELNEGQQNLAASDAKFQDRRPAPPRAPRPDPEPIATPQGDFFSANPEESLAASDAKFAGGPVEFGESDLARAAKSSLGNFNASPGSILEPAEGQPAPRVDEVLDRFPSLKGRVDTQGLATSILNLFGANGILRAQKAQSTLETKIPGFKAMSKGMSESERGDLLRKIIAGR